MTPLCKINLVKFGDNLWCLIMNYLLIFQSHNLSVLDYLFAFLIDGCFAPYYKLVYGLPDGVMYKHYPCFVNKVHIFFCVNSRICIFFSKINPVRYKYFDFSYVVIRYRRRADLAK